VIGQIIYHASGRRLFRYQEEIEGFVVPERYLPQDARGLDTPSSTITNTTAVAGDNGEGDGEKGKEVVVDWYGDDDPENPQNWYVSISFHIKSVDRRSSADETSSGEKKG
jgi:DHA1 family multidrug resistance protein-like MFS transporter